MDARRWHKIEDKGVPNNLNWKLKSLIQRTCAALPVGQESVYYFLQSNFGSMRRAPDPFPNLEDAATIGSELLDLGFRFDGKRVMEVGTGRRLDMPLAFHLMGAASTATVDLHQYLRPEYALAALRVMLERRNDVVRIFSPLVGSDMLTRRLDRLASVQSIEQLLALTGIEYHSPVDATKTSLPSASIDLQFSYTVFEHIPREVLLGILSECSRLLKPGGYACHHIDLSDHFAHDDASITFINFLQFDEREWSRYNDNQFAYQNRMRVTDFEKLYKEARHKPVLWKPFTDKRGLAALAGGFPLAGQYRGVPHDILGTVVVRAISQPA